ncbi:MAG: hypothetical protein LBT93_08395 [Treponema sp.]|jgi:hypothetical protein|nr:hypothetical protein [Treponema sp.]
MKKMTYWGFILFLSLVLLGACDTAPTPSHGWLNSTWQYDGEVDDTIKLGADTLTYYNSKNGEKQTLSVTVAGETPSLLEKTKNAVTNDERILAWIVDAGKGESLIYGIIYGAIEWTGETTWEDLKDEPHKIKLLAPEITSNLDLEIKVPPIYIEK